MDSVLKKAIDLAGGQTVVARACNVQQPTVNRWYHRGWLPRTEWTGETKYADTIAGLQTEYTRDDLLSIKRGAA